MLLQDVQGNKSHHGNQTHPSVDYLTGFTSPNPRRCRRACTLHIEKALVWIQSGDPLTVKWQPYSPSLFKFIYFIGYDIKADCGHHDCSEAATSFLLFICLLVCCGWECGVWPECVKTGRCSIISGWTRHAPHTWWRIWMWATCLNADRQSTVCNLWTIQHVHDLAQTTEVHLLICTMDENVRWKCELLALQGPCIHILDSFHIQYTHYTLSYTLLIVRVFVPYTNAVSSLFCSLDTNSWFQLKILLWMLYLWPIKYSLISFAICWMCYVHFPFVAFSSEPSQSCYSDHCYAAFNISSHITQTLMKYTYCKIQHLCFHSPWWVSKFAFIFRFQRKWRHSRLEDYWRSFGADAK